MTFDSKGLAVFDIGGTWFRSGVYSESGELGSLDKVPALNYKNTSYTNASELQFMLLNYLVERMDYFRSQGLTLNAASISMGAALNGHTGEILNSGPLWGPDCKEFDLLGNLQSKMPEVKWTIVNDVSAALLRHTRDEKYANKKRINLITVSSGIACRTYDSRTRNIPLNSAGIQGEIGHIPIQFSTFDQPSTLLCDCGGLNHLNAFCSGRGIQQVLNSIDADILKRYSNSLFAKTFLDKRSVPMNQISQLFDAIKQKDEFALRILDTVTYPIAQMIVYILTIDAEIEKIIMTGGVVHSIEEQYMDSLMKNLETIGMYQTSRSTDFFREIIDVGVDDDNSGLIGAAIAHENGSN